MGKALLRLSFKLLAVDNLDKAAEWTVKLQQFGTVFSTQLKARTYVKDVPFDQIPKSKRRNKKLWYTHYTHRGIYLQLKKMSQQGHLFAYLTEAEEGQRFERTTNKLEGGVNSQIKNGPGPCCAGGVVDVGGLFGDEGEFDFLGGLGDVVWVWSVVLVDVACDFLGHVFLA